MSRRRKQRIQIVEMAEDMIKTTKLMNKLKNGW